MCVRQARKESDCGSAQNGGDLGMFGRGMMQKPFEDVRRCLCTCHSRSTLHLGDDLDFLFLLVPLNTRFHWHPLSFWGQSLLGMNHLTL